MWAILERAAETAAGSGRGPRERRREWVWLTEVGMDRESEARIDGSGKRGKRVSKSWRIWGGSDG